MSGGSLALLRERLDTAGLAYQYLDGSTPAAERGKRVAAFQQGSGDFFLISLKAGGFGLNLTAADYVIIADPWWNPAAEDQASGAPTASASSGRSRSIASSPKARSKTASSNCTAANANWPRGFCPDRTAAR